MLDFNMMLMTRATPSYPCVEGNIITFAAEIILLLSEITLAERMICFSTIHQVQRENMIIFLFLTQDYAKFRFT